VRLLTGPIRQHGMRSSRRWRVTAIARVREFTKYRVTLKVTSILE